MTQNLHVVLYPILNILRFAGLNIFCRNSFQKSSLWPYYTILLMIYLLAQYFVNMFHLLMSLSPRDSGFSMFLSVITASIAEVSCAFFSLFMTLKSSEKKKQVILKLFKIENKFFLLNMGIKYSKFQWYSRIIIFSSVMMFFFLSDLFFQIRYDPTRIRTVMMLRYSARLISWFDVFYFLVILKIIRLHFERINTEMIILKKFQNHSKKDSYLRIKNLNEMHKSLRNICKIHNESYNLQLLWLTYFLMSITTVLMYLIFVCTVIYFVLKDDVPVLAGYTYYSSWTTLYYLFSYFVLKVITGVAEEVSHF